MEKLKTGHRKLIMMALAEKYPAAISLVFHKVVPLIDEIENEIFYDLGVIPPEYKRSIYISMHWYRHLPSYLQALAFGKHKHNLAGHRISLPTVSERNAARSLLKESGQWTKRMEMVYKVNLGRKEAANRVFVPYQI